jgi:hypothetical protein
MKLKYRILDVNEEDQNIRVRYYTTVVTEDMLAAEFNSDGTIKRDAEGYPERCITDYQLSVYVVQPTAEDIETLIINYAPIDFLRMKESVKTVLKPTFHKEILKLKKLEKEIKIPDKFDAEEMSEDDIETLLNSIVKHKL